MAELWEEICCGHSRFKGPTPMKQIISILARHTASFIILSILNSATLLSQYSASNQVVTLEVLELNKVIVSKQLLALESPLYYQSSSEGPVVSAQTRLVWTSNGEWRKISVASKQASRSCIVHISLQEMNGDTNARHQLELTDASTHDFIQGLSKSAGSCGVRFSVIMRDPDGEPAHFHSVVYTVTSS